MMTILRYKWAAAITLALGAATACDKLTQIEQIDFDFSKPEVKKEECIQLSDISFSEDFNTIKVLVNITGEMPSVALDDLDNVRITATDKTTRANLLPAKLQPQLITAKSVGESYVQKENLYLLALVDLSRPEEEIDNMRRYLSRMHVTYGDGNMFLAFLLPDGQKPLIIPASKYVLSNYINKSSKLTEHYTNEEFSTFYLYRGILDLLNGVTSASTGTALDSGGRISFAIFSGDSVFDDINNYPKDPLHFEVQENLMRVMDRIPDNISVFFFDGAKTREGETKTVSDNMMDLLCKKTGGQYILQDSPSSMISRFFKSFSLNLPDYEFTFKNVEDILYYGKERIFTLEFRDLNGDLVATGSINYRASGEDGFSVSGNMTLGLFVLRLVLILLLILALAFVTIQIAIPRAKYLVFKKKYLVKYTGANQCVNSMQIPDSCYMCKAPFQKGDSIVVKCAHVVHESCWNENDYQCPEHGANCPNGSHYYDRKNLLNRRNAPFYANWVFLAIVMIIGVWALNLGPFSNLSCYPVVEQFGNTLASKSAGGQHNSLDILPVSSYLAPVYSFDFCFFLVFALSMLAMHRRKLQAMLTEAFFRAFSAALLSAAVMLLQCLFLLLFRQNEVSIIINCIIRSISIAIIEYAVAYRSNIRINHRKFIYAALILGCYRVITANILGSRDTLGDFQMYFVNDILVAVAIAVVLAHKIPYRQKCFLHVSGSSKDIDVALYKWFRQNPNAVVTIGKSVDCSLQLFWEYESEISPVHTSIRMVNGVHCLCVSENDVIFNGKRAEYNKKYPLYYGDVFQIGHTQFKYMGV